MAGMRVALITGACGGIGSALCRAFREDGYRVVGIDRRGHSEECDASLTADVART